MRAAAPGKLILTGEHAVVYGCPALVTAVNRYVEATLEPGPSGEVSVTQPGLADPRRYTHAELLALLADTRAAYAEFQRGERAIEAVLPCRTDLAALALAHVVEARGRGSEPGLELTVNVGLPVGCGMGASAAVALAVLQAGSAAFGLGLDRDQLYDCAIRIEGFIHGRPSGVDPYACLHGGMWRFQAGAATRTPTPASGFFAVHSGRPQCSTGECVAAVARQAVDTTVWNAFTATADDLQAALGTGQPMNVRQAVRRNHRLLRDLGVVPARVEAFVAAVEAEGGAAKVSGAGAIRGDAGGIILVFADRLPVALCREFGYEALALQPAREGVRILGDGAPAPRLQENV